MKLSYRNSRGNEIRIPTIGAASAKSKFDALIDEAANRGAVAITRDHTPKAVLLSYDEFESLVKGRSHTLEKLSADLDRRVARMQSPAARRAMDAAFNASPAELGRVAAKAARKSR